MTNQMIESNSSAFKTQHTQRCEEWRLLKASNRATYLQSASEALALLTGDAEKALRLFTHILAQAPALDEVTELTGATGESNELYVTARGKTMIVGTESATPLPVVGQLLAALLAGNEVILHYPSEYTLCEQIQVALREAGVVEDVISVANDSQTEVLLHMDRLAAVGLVGSQSEVDKLAAIISNTDGILTQVIAVTDMQGCHEILAPEYLLRYVTERVITINTTAIGGNASLIELGMG